MSLWENKDAEEEGEDEDEESFGSTADRLVFLIDGRRAMYESTSCGESRIRNCLRIAIEVMKMKVIADDSSSIGIVIFGSDIEGGGGEHTANVVTLLSLGAVTAQRMRFLKEVLADEQLFRQHVGHPMIETNTSDGGAPRKAIVPLKQSLWLCSQAFAGKDLKKTDSKRVWLFTNDDNPNGFNSGEQQATVTVARDCAHAQVELSLWHMNPADRRFDVNRFYSTFLKETSLDGDGDADISGRVMNSEFDSFDTIFASVRRKEFRKRRMSTLRFVLGNDTAENDQPVIALQLYKSVQIAKKPLHKWLSSRSNEPLKSMNRVYDEMTGETVLPESIDTFFDLGFRRVLVSKDEVQAWKADYCSALPPELSAPMVENSESKTDAEGANLWTTSGSLQLMYFISKQEFEALCCNVATPYFVYPDEKAVTGSNRLFESMVRECCAQRQVMIAKLCVHKSSAPRMVAAIGQLEIVDEDGCQSAPLGFHLIPLPFADDMRFNPLGESLPIEDSAEEVDNPAASAMDELVNALTLADDFSYRDVENPVLQQFYSILQSIALNESETEFDAEKNDKMRMPQALAENLSVNELCQAINNMFSLNQIAEAVTKGASKRKSSEDNAKTKKIKPDPEEVDVKLEKEVLYRRIMAGEHETMTVAELKTYCKALGQQVSGTKDALIRRLSTACANAI